MLGGIGAAAAEGTLGIAAEHFGSFLGRKPGGSALFGFKILGSGLAPLALPELLLLLAGVIVGVFLSLGGIKKMLEQHRSAAMYAILGMMVASLYAIVMGPMTLEDPKPAMSVETFHVVWFIAGCAAVLGINLFKHWIDRKGRKAE